MHNLTKIRIFRILLWITYPVSALLFLPVLAFRTSKIPRLVFFFDRYSIGGAQRVHLDLLEAVNDQEKMVFFTRKSPNDTLKKDFFSLKNTRSIDIHFWCDNLLLRLFSVHYYSFLLNTGKAKVVLSANSTFFYDMLPFLKKSLCRIELLHNFSYGKKGMEFFGLANRKYLDKRLVIDAITRENILAQYKKYQVAREFSKRVEVIEFGVDIPASRQKNELPPLRILYAGRGTAQKRIWLLIKIAEHFIGRQQEVTFVFAGSMGPELSPAVKRNYKVLPEISNRDEIAELYKDAHAIILMSSFEGFPVFIKEGMAFGCVPIVTALPGIKTHLIHGSNALLMDEPADENKVVDQAINFIEQLLRDENLRLGLSRNASQYASAHFNKTGFMQRYRFLLLSENCK